MDIQNKRIPEGEFQSLRQEVLTQWPTGKDVNLEEAVAYHKAMPEYRKFGKKLLDAKQEGKNLSGVKRIVVTGGSLIHTQRTEQIARHALYDLQKPESLRPKVADVLVDRTYILAAMGLLASHYPQVALRIMKKELEYHGHSE